MRYREPDCWRSWAGLFIVMVMPLAAAWGGSPTITTAQSDGAVQSEAHDFVALLGTRQWSSVEVRDAILNALLSLKSKEAVPLLLTFLDDPREMVRIKAVDGLGDLKAREAVRPINNLLKERNAGVRLRAVLALRKIGGNEAFDSVVAALSDENKQVREGALRGVMEMKEHVSEPLLRDLLKNKDGQVRIAAIKIAGAKRSPEAVGIVRSSLRDQDEKVRAEALMTLARIGGRGLTAEDITGFLSDTSPYVRSAAVAAASTLNDPRRTKMLGDKVRDPDERVRQAVAIACGAMQPDDALPILRELAADQSAAVRRATVGVLLSFRKTPLARELLMALASDKDLSIAVAALQMLADDMKGEEAWKVISAAYSRAPADVRVQLMPLIAARTEPAAAILVKDAAKDPNSAMRWAAVRAMSMSDAELAVEVARLAISGGDVGLRKEVVHQLSGKANDVRAQGLLQEMSSDPDPSVAKMAKDVLEARSGAASHPVN